MEEMIKALLTAFLGGGIGVAVVTLLGDRWKWRDERKALKEDREAEKQDRSKVNSEKISAMQTDEQARNVALEERLTRMEAQIDNQTAAMRIILLDRIQQFGEYLTSQGNVTFEQRHRFGDMHKEYKALGGNGDADFILEAVNRLSMKRTEGETPNY